MKYTSRADLLIAAGESIKMQEKAGITPVVKANSAIDQISDWYFTKLHHDYEFPLAVVEGKPVFVGDELYSLNLKTWITVQNSYPNDKTVFNQKWIESVSWDEPKSATVLVELTREDAEQMATQAQERLAESYAIDRVGLACRKALESK